MNPRLLVISGVGVVVLGLCTLAVTVIGVAGWFAFDQGDSLLVAHASEVSATSELQVVAFQVEETAAAGQADQAAHIDEPTPTPAATPARMVYIPTVTPEAASLDGLSDLPAAPGVATRLVIPSLNLDRPIRFAPISDGTWAVDHLEQEIGHLEGTASPGAADNMVLAGHVTLASGVPGPFAQLSQLAPGDLVIVYAGEQEYRYLIDRYHLVDPTNVQVIYPSTTPELTLITCNNWSREEGRYRYRLVFKGHLITE